MGRKNNDTNGFTLVELMIVVGILAIIATIALAYFRNQIFKGNDARRKSDMNRIRISLEEYEKDHNCYPLPFAVSCDPGTGLKPYLEKVPCDPATQKSYTYEYDGSSCPKWYRLYTVLDNKNDPKATENIGPNSAYDYYQDSPNAPAIGSSSGSGGTTGGGTSGPPPGVTFFGCKAGVCQQINWDPTRPGPECDPNYTTAGCYGQCGPQTTECVAWH